MKQVSKRTTMLHKQYNTTQLIAKANSNSLSFSERHALQLHIAKPVSANMSLIEYMKRMK